MSFSDFSFGNGCSTLVLNLIVSGLRRYFLYAKFLCSTFFFFNALYFPRLLPSACEIMVLMFLDSKTILLLLGISYNFC